MAVEQSTYSVVPNWIYSAKQNNGMKSAERGTKTTQSARQYDELFANQLIDTAVVSIWYLVLLNGLNMDVENYKQYFSELKRLILLRINLHSFSGNTLITVLTTHNRVLPLISYTKDYQKIALCKTAVYNSYYTVNIYV